MTRETAEAVVKFSQALGISAYIARRDAFNGRLNSSAWGVTTFPRIDGVITHATYWQ